MKFATIDNKGRPTGFYSKDVHGDDIPSAVVPMSDAIWQHHIEGTAQAYNKKSKTWADYVPSAAEKAKHDSEQHNASIMAAMPSVADQLDAIWMQLNAERMAGKNLVAPADDILGQILAVKKKLK